MWLRNLQTGVNIDVYLLINKTRDNTVIAKIDRTSELESVFSKKFRYMPML